MRVNEVLETCLYVDDLDAAHRFYGEVLGLDFFQREADRHVFFRCGNRMLLLFNAVRSVASDSSLPPHGACGAGHVAFAVPDEEIAAWRRHLEQQQVTIEQVVCWPQGGHSLYFRDPAGNSLELASPRIWGFEELATMPKLG
jgi:catechol 2,3-dioxygenase-like lactoylglutathione lyase family enzyme